MDKQIDVRLAQKVERHMSVCRTLNTIYDQKNRDYADSFAKSLATYGMAMPCIRLEDKLNRLRALTVKKQAQQVDGESIMDTLKDLANYAIMTIIELEMQAEQGYGIQTGRMDCSLPNQSALPKVTQ